MLVACKRRGAGAEPFLRTGRAGGERDPRTRVVVRGDARRVDMCGKGSAYEILVGIGLSLRAPQSPRPRKLTTIVGDV